MDRFRVKALLKALDLNLSGPDRVATGEMIVKKCTVLANGYRKRGKLKEAEHYEAIIKRMN